MAQIDDPKYKCFFTAKNPKKTLRMAFNVARKRVVLDDEDEFIEFLTEYLIDEFQLTEKDAEEYSRTIFDIWEDCSCSMTAFQNEMRQIQTRL